MAWKDIVKSVKSGTDTMASVGKDSYQDNYVDVDSDAGKDFSQVFSENASSFTAALEDVAKSIKSGADAVASVGKGSVSNKNSVIRSSLNDIDISVDGDAGKDFAHASPVSSENHSATISEAFDNAINGTGTLADAVKAAKESQVQDEPGTLGAIKEKIGSVGDMMKDKAVNAVDSVKEHVGRVVDFAPEEPVNDSDSGYDLG